MKIIHASILHAKKKQRYKNINDTEEEENENNLLRKDDDYIPSSTFTAQKKAKKEKKEKKEKKDKKKKKTIDW